MSASLTYVLLTLCLGVFALSLGLGEKIMPRVFTPLARWGWAFQLAALFAAYFVLRPGSSDDLSSLQEQAQREHKPLLLSFHSNN